MRWPTLRSKLLPLRVIRTPLRWGPWFQVHALRNEQYGNWWGISLGRWVIIGGKGQEEPPGRTSVVRVQGLAETKPQGLEIGEALMGDGRTVRFKVVARKPVAVQAI